MGFCLRHFQQVIWNLIRNSRLVASFPPFLTRTVLFLLRFYFYGIHISLSNRVKYV